ncbi:MAG TPA: NmrA family NAD(P)-binding protein [Gemmatimonadales bacterium]|nr:NmrA family NAD(P)-binding protein [Gemmatimonadales bacterium]
MPTHDPILVAGASGQLGGTIARLLLAEGVRVRALARRLEPLRSLADLGAELVATDLRDTAGVRQACDGAGQVVSTANNVRGRGASSPTRVDLAAYRSLARAARDAGISRWLHVSARGLTADSVVDFFRVKHQVDQVVSASGVPWVLLQPSAFMEVWIDLILAGAMREKGEALLFGDGHQRANYIAVDDVARLAVAILTRPEVRNEAIEIGGPSDVSMRSLVDLLERAMGITAKRRHVPMAVLRLVPPLLRPFNEVAARMMTLGAFAAANDTSFPQWRDAADRFGVTPRSVEAYIAERFGR